MKEKYPITLEDMELCVSISNAISNQSIPWIKYKPTVTCDRDNANRIKDYCIRFKQEDNPWLETVWFNMGPHPTKDAKYYFDRIVVFLKSHAKELGIKDIQPRNLGIIFNRRSRR